MTIWTMLCAVLFWVSLIGGTVAAVGHMRRRRRTSREAADRRRFIEEQIRRARGE